MLTSTPKKTKRENDEDITELCLDTVELDSSRDEVFISSNVINSEKNSHISSIHSLM